MARLNFSKTQTPMKKNILIASISIIASCAGFSQAEKNQDGFVSLLEGETLKGWTNPYAWGESKIVNGEVHLKADKKFFLITEKKYSNFIFEGEILLPEGKANSGFMFRAQTGPGRVFGYQAEVDGDPVRKWSGGLYDEGRRTWFVSPIRGDKASEEAFRARAGDCFKRNDWNTYRITCKGNHITIEVNGVLVSDFKDDKDASGVIGIQHHGEKGQIYKFRNLKIKELD
jgi:Domain of Unknown Function (DUF1080)